VGYLGPDGTYVRPNPTTTWASLGLTELKDAAAQKLMARTGPLGGTESQWGIWSIYTMDAGTTATANEIFRKLGGDASYTWTDAVPNVITGDTCLVGVFYNGWDSKVVLADGGKTLTTYVEDVKFELWAVDRANVDLLGGSQGPGFDSNLRTAQNRYATWVDGTGKLLLTGTSTYFRFTGTQQYGPLAFDGQSATYWDVDENGAGLWDWEVGTNKYFTDPDGASADLKLTFDIDPGLDGWTVNSHDNGGFLFAVPEPLTMVGVFASIGGLCGYIQRRRKAVA